MRTIVNKLGRPLRIPLPQGKVLHLGPKMKGQIAENAVDHEPLRELVEAGSVEILEGGPGWVPHGHGEEEPGPHARTHGYHPRDSKVRGDR